MKKIGKLMNNCWLQRLTLFVVSLICVVGSVQAGDKYYYKAVAKVVPTGGGKVYAEVSNTSGGSNKPTYTKNEYSSEVTDVGGNESYCHFYALSMEGYKFVKWTLDEAGNNQEGIQYASASKQHCYITVTNNSSGTENCKTTTCYAHFKPTTGMVKVAVDGDVGGTVSISNPDNEINNEITITASPSGSYLFKGWYKHSGTTQKFITTDSPYTFTVTENITYYAHFERATTEYCTLKNVSTGKYLSLFGDYSATHPDNAYVFTKSLKTIFDAEANNNPLIVFKRVTNSGTGYLSTDLSNGSGVITTNTLIGKYTPLTFTLQENGKYRISATIDDVTYYLCDDGSEFVSLQSSNTKDIDWEITIMTEETGFGINANPKYTRGGKYYTSMYAPFAYKLGNGVKAYYLDLDADNYDETTNTLTLSEISSGNFVPENMAVIIECSSANDPTGNQLLPVNKYTISNEQKENYGSNVLIGYNYIVCHEENGYYQEVSNVKEYMYVFSIKNNNLGFYHYSGDIIPKNKAYLHLSVKLEELADYLSDNPNPIKLAFGSQFDDDLLNSIRLSNEEADDTDLPIYNLQGVQVKNPEKGIYIRGGKKYLVK